MHLRGGAVVAADNAVEVLLCQGDWPVDLPAIPGRCAVEHRDPASAKVRCPDSQDALNIAPRFNHKFSIIALAPKECLSASAVKRTVYQGK